MIESLPWQTIILIAVAGGVIGLDRTAVGQFMISQPIVAAPLAGWLLGDAPAGFAVGAVLEMIWVLDLPVGTFVPADSTIAAVSATTVAALGSRGVAAGPEMIGFCILLTTAMAPVTMAADRFMRDLNGRIAKRAMNADDAAVERRIIYTQVAGMAVFFLKFFLLYLVLVPSGLLAAAAFRAMPVKVHEAMVFFLMLLPLLGAAMVIHKLSRERVDRFVLFGFVAALLTVLLFRLHPVIAVFAAAVSGWLGVRYHER